MGLGYGSGSDEGSDDERDEDEQGRNAAGSAASLEARAPPDVFALLQAEQPHPEAEKLKAERRARAKLWAASRRTAATS